MDDKATKVMLKGESTCGAGRASGADDAYMVLGDYASLLPDLTAGR